MSPCTIYHVAMLNLSCRLTIQKQIEILRDKFRCENVTLVGDRGMLKTPQIDALPKGFNYITGIGKSTIKKLEKRRNISI